MALSKREAEEWKSLRAKSKRHGIPVKRVGPANVQFGLGVFAQLGTGRATMIMDARIAVKKKRGLDKKIGERWIGGKNRILRRTKTGYTYYYDKGKKVITTLKPVR